MCTEVNPRMWPTKLTPDPHGAANSTFDPLEDFIDSMKWAARNVSNLFSKPTKVAALREISTERSFKNFFSRDENIFHQFTCHYRFLKNIFQPPSIFCETTEKSRAHLIDCSSHHCPL